MNYKGTLKRMLLFSCQNPTVFLLQGALRKFGSKTETLLEHFPSSEDMNKYFDHF